MIHNRPESGVGKLLLSHDDNHHLYNEHALMVTFDLECLNGDEDIQGEKVNSIINHFDGCLSSHHLTSQHFQMWNENEEGERDGTGFGVSFLEFIGNNDQDNGINCLNNHKNSDTFDYDQHCIYMFSYEPTYDLDDFVTNYTVFTSPNEYSCKTQLTNDASLPSGWAWGLDQTDSINQDNLFTYPVVDG